MKKLLALSLVLLGFASLSLQAAADRRITYGQLPRPAQNFIETYFAGRSATEVSEDMDDRSVLYEVTLSDGVEIDFDAQGQWKKVEGDRIALPTGFIPAPILQHLRQRRPGDQVMEIEKNRQGYTLELSSGIKAYYNQQLKFVRFDD